ncbi:unnamed protein product [Ranitomeya imitator]|uniref:YTH domain-containing family protein n=1 Tax=Ranitomeya imitator TaxID=111125 RepID=A0ABN9M3S0_9NEOB|nr:unnamed protein product [Ranitomeya imitator]
MEDRSTATLATLKLDEWLHFKFDQESANLLVHLRQKWYSLFLRRMKSPSKPWSQVDEATIRAVITVLTNEEQSACLQQPSGIGQRPRPMSSEELPASSSWRTNPSHRSSAEIDFSDDLYSLDSGRAIKSLPMTFSQQPKLKERVLQHPKRLEDKIQQMSAKFPEGSSYSSPCASPSLPASIKSSKSPSPQPNLPVRYFIMKSSNLRNLDISQQKGIWSTTPSNECKLNRAFWECSTVYLVFSVQGSGHFQGFARMCSEIGQEKSKDWGSITLGGVFKVEWIRKDSVPFQNTHHLLNPWNENKKVQISRDGQSPMTALPRSKSWRLRIPDQPWQGPPRCQNPDWPAPDLFARLVLSFWSVMTGFLSLKGGSPLSGSAVMGSEKHRYRNWSLRLENSCCFSGTEFCWVIEVCLIDWILISCAILFNFHCIRLDGPLDQYACLSKAATPTFDMQQSVLESHTCGDGCRRFRNWRIHRY